MLFKEIVMYKDLDEVLKNFYGMAKPDPRYMEERMKKVAVIIESMGDKYCLAKLVEKKHG